METMKAYVIQKGDKYFVGGNMFEWSYDLQNAHRFLKKERAEGAIQKYGCLENSTIIDCVIKYEDVYTFIKKDDSSTRPLTPEILTAAGYTKRHENEADHQKAIDTANELAAYKDKTYISEDFLARNGFEKREYDFLYCDDVEEIFAQCIDAEMGIWRVSIGFLESGNNDCLDICTVGQMRMFLAIEGLTEIAKQIKS